MAPANKVGKRGPAQGSLPLAGRYVLGELLGTGQGGEVHLARDLAGGRPCAVKLAAPGPEPGAPARLLDEFARLTDLHHPGVVKVRDAGRASGGVFDGRVYLVTDHLSGPTLGEELASCPPGERLARFAAAAEALADALAYLHGRDIVHGDVSPANVRCTEDGRPVLIDLGLSRRCGQPTGTGATGTLGFIAPEALVGERGPATDLFGLGATLYEAWTGVAPFGVGLEALRRLWEGPPPAPSLVCPGLPPSWDALFDRLLAFAPEARPASARELLRQIRRLSPGHEGTIELCVPHPAGDPLAGLLVGRAEQQAALLRLLEQLGEGAAPVAALAVLGPEGAGRRALIARCLRDLRLAMLSRAAPGIELPLHIHDSGFADLARSLGGELDDGPGGAEGEDPARTAQARRVALVKALELRAGERPLCVVLGPGRDEEALAEAVAGNLPSGRLLVLLPAERALSCGGAGSIALAPLEPQHIRELAVRASGEDVPDGVVDRIARATGGQAAAATLLVRQWVQQSRGGAPVPWPDDGNPDLEHLLDRSFAALSPLARRWVAAVALAPGPEEAPAMAGLDAGQVAPAMREARAAGWLLASGDRLPTGLHLQAVCRALTRDGGLHALARACINALDESDPRRAEAHLALGERAEAARCFRSAARAAVLAGHHGEVARWGLCALRAQPAGATFEELVAWASALGIVGRYAEAMEVLDATRPETPAERAAIAERRAWLLGRRGDPLRAHQVLQSALLDVPDDQENEPLRLALRARLARSLVLAGRLGDALRAAEPALESPLPAADPAREAAVLAHAHAGRIAEAEALLDRIETRAEQGLPTARLRALRGLVCQLTARPVEAAGCYRAAVEGYESARDVHGLAAARFNLGCTLAETGRYGDALDFLERASADLGRLGATADLALALFNTGQLLLQVGDIEAAGRAARRLYAEAAAARGEAFAAYARCLDADLARRQQSSARAVPLYAQAGEAFARMGNRAMALATALAHAEALAEAGQPDEALRAWQGAGAAGAAFASAPAAIDEPAAMSRARIALACAPEPAHDGDLAASLANLARVAAEQGRWPAAWHAGCLAARLWSRLGDIRAAEELERATRIFEEIKMNTPVQFRAGLDSSPEAPRARFAGEARLGPGAPPDHAGRAEARLRRLLRINKRLNSDLRLARVLETVVDTVIELTDAERGFLLLKDGSGELAVRVARNIDQTTLEAPEFALSRSIAKQAADSGEPVITVDAAGDLRFREAVSVSDLHLRSVLAVPLAVKGSVVGTIYVDHRLRKGAFDDEALTTVLDFAEQAAIAIENARLLTELRRRETQVQALNRRLENELRAREQALQGAREELKESRDAATLRYDYRQIVGRTPRMLELFRLLDRVTDTALPVVIEGESGTGKELVARAIHFNGPRRERAFVSENCAAIPETLLESTLFGHVRGAFTGADREARGLFAVADGGTLFLDEVAEMSPAMQGKLLRVLQDGEFHRVGGERPQKVDVRIMVATNRDLGRMVEQGKFRQDLFFRLSVVRLVLPPLRERREDIPLLVQHMLGKAATAGSDPRTVDAAALARLCAYRWPGNVRELENEIARAGAFCGGRITVADLSPHVAAGSDPGLAITDESDGLRLRSRVERIERLLIREAMQRHAGNQTRAAEALGLSRFGLQKKLKRYHMAF